MAIRTSMLCAAALLFSHPLAHAGQTGTPQPHVRELKLVCVLSGYRVAELAITNGITAIIERQIQPSFFPCAVLTKNLSIIRRKGAQLTGQFKAGPAFVATPITVSLTDENGAPVTLPPNLWLVNLRYPSNAQTGH